jgi:hypothetical protein
MRETLVEMERRDVALNADSYDIRVKFDIEKKNFVRGKVLWLFDTTEREKKKNWRNFSSFLFRSHCQYFNNIAVALIEEMHELQLQRNKNVLM